MDVHKILEEKIKEECRPHEGKVLALSGGVDSSLLAVYLKPKFAISVELPGGEKYNEIEWAKKVCAELNIEHVIVKCDESKFDEYVEIAVKAIGRPIPHFNIFPLYCMYKKLFEMGETELVLGDGPDETMHGYARDLIVHHLYTIYEIEAFSNYHELLHKVLPPLHKVIKKLTGFNVKTMLEADLLMRKDMDDMSDGIAGIFGIKNVRPYQDNKELDNYMRDLPIEQKIQGEYGKWALRQILAQYLPEIADRKVKVGGPVYPVNTLKGWLDDGEFSKTKWLEYQKSLLS
jgi:asparagine synthetase B (glutamine-hydrolysing)